MDPTDGKMMTIMMMITNGDYNVTTATIRSIPNVRGTKFLKLSHFQERQITIDRS